MQETYKGISDGTLPSRFPLPESPDPESPDQFSEVLTFLAQPLTLFLVAITIILVFLL